MGTEMRRVSQALGQARRGLCLMMKEEKLGEESGAISVLTFSSGFQLPLLLRVSIPCPQKKQTD